jgi:MYXO-CTERM domain-containing protein
MQIVRATDVGPFSSPYGPSLASDKLTDGVLANASPSFSQRFATITTRTQLSFDFKLSSFSDDYWLMKPAMIYSDGGGDYLLNLRLGDRGNFVFLGGNFRFEIPLSIDVWYRVYVDFDFAGDNISGDITRYGGATLAWSGSKSFLRTTSMNFLFLQDAVSTTAKNGDIYLDNLSLHDAVSLTPGSEPSAYGLFAAVGLVGLAVLRRMNLVRARLL